MRFTMTAIAVAVLALGAGATLGACGSDDEEAVSGQFELLSGAPSGYEELSGEATLERDGEGTQASIELTGLEPATEYVAHVHAAGCDRPDPGGAHYRFDPQGSGMPPNEVHLSFTSNAEGEGEAEASNDRQIPDGDAGSIVVHTAEADGGGAKDGDAMHQGGGGHSHSDKVACAELEGGKAPVEAESTREATRQPATAIVVRDGEPVGGVRELTYDAGERVRFRVRSDVADEVHVHGYDVTEDVPAGGSSLISFPADIEGIFEVELHGSGRQIAELRIEP